MTIWLVMSGYGNDPCEGIEAAFSSEVKAQDYIDLKIAAQDKGPGHHRKYYTEPLIVDAVEAECTR